MKKFLDKLQEEINIANNRSKMQHGKNSKIQKAKFEGKRDGLIMVMRELKKFNSTSKLKQDYVRGKEALRLALPSDDELKKRALIEIEPFVPRELTHDIMTDKRNIWLCGASWVRLEICKRNQRGNDR